MKRILSFAIIVVFLGTALFLTKTAKADEYVQGKKLYIDKCQLCHGVKGDGNGPAGAGLSPKPADFTKSSFWQGDVDKKITDTILHGHGPMPAFNLTPDETKAIIDYMFHTFKK